MTREALPALLAAVLSAAEAMLEALLTPAARRRR
jgi:hypothetical protein